MKTYKSYVEAAIANGSTKGVVTTRDDWVGFNIYRGRFNFETEHVSPHICEGGWKPCNPADHLENMHDFFEKGLKLVRGDKYTGLSGGVYTVGVDASESEVNARMNGDGHRYVVKAAAYETETPEEKEVFEAMTDTAPQQVESLSDSEKPNNSEWKNGDACIFGADDRSGIYVAYDAYNEGHVIYSGGEYHHLLDDFSRPETPEQRAERERNEAIDQMMSFTKHGVYSAIYCDLCAKLYDAGYRKETN